MTPRKAGVRHCPAMGWGLCSEGKHGCKNEAADGGLVRKDDVKGGRADEENNLPPCRRRAWQPRWGHKHGSAIACIPRVPIVAPR